MQTFQKYLYDGEEETELKNVFQMQMKIRFFLFELLWEALQAFLSRDMFSQSEWHNATRNKVASDAKVENCLVCDFRWTWIEFVISFHFEQDNLKDEGKVERAFEKCSIELIEIMRCCKFLYFLDFWYRIHASWIRNN